MFDERYLGNFIALFSTTYNCCFIFISGEYLHLFGGALGIVFTCFLNFRRAVREVNQVYLILKHAKNAKRVKDLLEEDLEKEKADED